MPVVYMPGEAIAEIDIHDRVTLRVSAVHDHHIIAMESLEPRLQEAARRLHRTLARFGIPPDQLGEVIAELENELLRASDPDTYINHDLDLAPGPDDPEPE